MRGWKRPLRAAIGKVAIGKALIAEDWSEAVEDALEVFETACGFLMCHGAGAVAAIEERIAWDRMRDDRLSAQVWEDVAAAARVLLASRPCLSACRAGEASQQRAAADLCLAQLWGVEERRRAS